MIEESSAAIPSRGIIYLAAGGRSYLGELLESLESLRKHEPDLPVSVFSPFKPPRSARCEHIPYTSSLHPLKQKVQVLQQSPYEQTLFLDTDTTVLGPVTPIFDFLQKCDFSVGNMYGCDWTVSPPKLLNLVKPDDYNTGVLLFNASAATKAFLQRWADALAAQDPKDMWAGHNCDQDYFNRIVSAGAMEQAAVRFQPFPNTIYNVRGIMVPELQRLGIWQDARILHHRTKAMKLRKALYSLTDYSTACEIARKAAIRLGFRLPTRKFTNE